MNPGSETMGKKVFQGYKGKEGILQCVQAGPGICYAGEYIARCC